MKKRGGNMKRILVFLLSVFVCSSIFAQGAKEIKSSFEGYGTQTRGDWMVE